MIIDAIIAFSIRHRLAVCAASLILAALGAWAAWQAPGPHLHRVAGAQPS
jgi:Cu/Ag efflux pump CusA